MIMPMLSKRPQSEVYKWITMDFEISEKSASLDVDIPNSDACIRRSSIGSIKNTGKRRMMICSRSATIWNI